MTKTNKDANLMDENGQILESSGQGPWGKRPSGNNPWGGAGDKGDKNAGSNRGRGSDSAGTPEFDEFFKKINDFFAGGGGSGKGGSPFGAHFGGKKIILIALLAVVVLWLASGFYRVLPEEDAVVLRFGEWNRTQLEPGLAYRLPWPIETVDKVNVEFQRRVEIGFEGTLQGRTNNRTLAYSGIRNIPEESLMLTGDENIIDIHFVVVWSIKDARNFLHNIRNPEDTVKKVAESAMREVIGQTEIQPALTRDRTAIEIRTKAIMQMMLDDYGSGVSIQAIQLQKVDPPAPVVDAFNEVQRARADRERLRNEAEAYRNDIIPRARGQAEKLTEDAEGYKQRVINESLGSAERFTLVYNSYKESPDVTRERLFIEAMEDVLQKSNTILLDSNVSGSGVLPYLPLNELRSRSVPRQTRENPNSQ